MNLDWDKAVAALIERLEQRGADSLFEPEALELAADMKARAPGKYIKLRQVLKGSGVVTVFERELARVSLTRSRYSAKDSASERPHVVVNAELKQMVDAASAALTRDPNIFERAGRLVQVRTDPAPGGNSHALASPPAIVPVGDSTLREQLSELIYWERPVGQFEDGSEQHEHVLPPDDVVRALGARGHWPGVPRLEAVVEWPVLAADGSVVAGPGYDASTGVVIAAGAPTPAVPDRPSRDDVVRAVDRLREVVVDFPFESPVHAIAWIAALLTLVVRFAIAGSIPMLLLDGNSPGSGKSKLADLLWLILTGRQMPRRPYVPDEGRMMSTVTSVVVGGYVAVLFDNVAAALGGAALDAALTGGFWQDRLFGKNDTTLSARIITFWMASGNNIALTGDLHRRVLPCRLRTAEESPENRTDFTHSDLFGWVRERRADLLAAALTILKGYAAAGRPPVRLKPWGGFEEWSAAVRAPLVWAGLPDPIETRSGLVNEAQAKLAALIDGWIRAFGEQSEPRTLREVVETILQTESNARSGGLSFCDVEERQHARLALERLVPLKAALTELAGLPLERANIISLGMKMRQFHQKNCAGRMLVQRTKEHTGAWVVVPVGPSGSRSSLAGSPGGSLDSTEAVASVREPEEPSKPSEKNAVDNNAIVNNGAGADPSATHDPPGKPVPEGPQAPVNEAGRNNL